MQQKADKPGIYPVSIHGGHSGRFCTHAQDSLEEIVARYHALGFAWVGLTEHVPPPTDELRYPDEIEAGLSASDLLDRFAAYMEEAGRIRELYRDRLPILVGMEIETCTGCLSFADRLRRRFTPDYIVGSVHHVDDICFDYSREEYLRAAEKAGGINALYLRYLDLQFEMINRLRPEVVGHFDLIRLFDDNYGERLEEPLINSRIERNLERIAQLGLVLDLNLRAMYKGAREPYPARSILEKAHRLGIAVIPGDDSHSVESVGCYMDEGIRILREIGFPSTWPLPWPDTSTGPDEGTSGA